MIKDYFIHYSSQEQRIINEWINNESWLKDEVISAASANTGFHDAIVTLKNGKTFFVEVKEDESYWYNKTGNIGLDYLSVFNFTSPHSIFEYPKQWVPSKHLSTFKKEINVNKWGKLFTCDAEVQLFYIKNIRCKAYSNKKLTNVTFVSYLENNYDLRINDKKKYNIKDTWLSAAYFIDPLKDEELIKCEINNLKELLDAIS